MGPELLPRQTVDLRADVHLAQLAILLRGEVSDPGVSAVEVSLGLPPGVKLRFA